MPQFEIPLIILSPNPMDLTSQNTPESIGSVITNIEVSDFINACSDEEYDDLVHRIREIENQSPLELPPGLRPINEEEAIKLGLPPLDENGNPIENNVDENEDKVKPINRKPINRANKRKKK
tara:strand:- start:657 stop:1022 length:366 start_codon:yes stop_codon:yes gene_type:complete